MAKYIDSEKAIDKLKRGFYVAGRSGKILNIVLETAIKTIEEMAAADVTEVKHGKWIKHSDDYDCEYIECSVCGEEFYPPENAFEFDKMPKYCQECGTKMDGERKTNERT